MPPPPGPPQVNWLEWKDKHWVQVFFKIVTEEYNSIKDAYKTEESDEIRCHMRQEYIEKVIHRIEHDFGGRYAGICLTQGSFYVSQGAQIPKDEKPNITDYFSLPLDSNFGVYIVRIG